jgi:hypothetical protein
LRGVACEQGADPDADARALFRAHEETVYIDRLAIDVKLAAIFIALRELDDDTRTEISEPVLKAVELFSRLDQRTQQSVAAVLLEAMTVVNARDGAERNKIGFAIAESVDRVLGPIKEKSERADEDVIPGLVALNSGPAPPAPATRVRQHAGN